MNKDERLRRLDELESMRYPVYAYTLQPRSPYSASHYYGSLMQWSHPKAFQYGSPSAPGGLLPGGGTARPIGFDTSLVDLTKRRTPVKVDALATMFYEATAQDIGLDEERLKPLLKTIYDNKLHHRFDLGVRHVFAQHGRQVDGALAVLRQKCMGNALKRFFKQSQYHELEDYLLQGKNTYRSSESAYFRHGMWRSLEDFLSICIKKPLMSLSIIGAVFALGHLVPFLGGASGIAIIGWSGAAMLLHADKASKISGMNEKKAEHLRMSGENLTAFAVTMLGYKGISESVKAGFKAIREPLPVRGSWNHVEKAIARRVKFRRSRSPKTRQLTRVWQDFRFSRVGHVLFKEPPPQKTQGWQAGVNQFLFISGLLDNVLLPFNAAADHFNSQRLAGRSH